jgi:hypothetical protein
MVKTTIYLPEDRLLAAMGKLDSSAYPPGYLDDQRAEWRG